MSLITPMILAYFLLQILFQSGYSLASRDGILTATYSEVLTLHQHGIYYLHRPLIVTDSAQSNWTLLENLDNIFDRKYEISAEQQTTNCSCLSQTDIYDPNGNIDLIDLCEHFSSALLYKRANDHYAYWNKYEGQHKFTRQGEDCITIQEKDMYVQDGFKALKFIEEHPGYSHYDIHHVVNDSKSDREKISKFRSYWHLFGFKEPSQEIDAIQLNTLDHIRLAPFFKIFDMNGFSDVNKLHIWFGTEYYRAIRHYDKSYNIFFVLKGSRHFRLSMPTINVFDMYPYNHASSRHTYPNYPLLEEYPEGRQIPDHYKIHEATVYENEVLYIPCYWYHEVINDNITIALSIWWNSNDDMVGEMVDMELPINPIHPDDDLNPDIDEYVIHKHGLDGFLYFTQIMIEEWCAYIYDHSEKWEYSLRCMNDEYQGYGFLLDNFSAIWGIIDDITFDNLEWYSIIIDIENILKCTSDRVADYEGVDDLKEHMYFCNDFEDEYKKMWNESVDDVMRFLKSHTNIGAAEANLVEYLEDKLLAAFADSNMLPIWIKMMKL